MTSTSDSAVLTLLGDTGRTVSVEDVDIRGRRVLDSHGKDIGHIADLLVDERQHRVRFLLVDHGGFLGIGRTKTLIPVGDITAITDIAVCIDHSLGHVADGPGYDPALEVEPVYLGTVYDHYGRPPYWGVGYGYVTSSRRLRPDQD